MASTWGEELACVCGARYADFRTQHTFASVRRQMKVATDDSSSWVYKRRGGILGYWHELKVEAWNLHVAECWSAAPAELLGDRVQPKAFRPLKGQPAPPRYRARQTRRGRPPATTAAGSETRATGKPGPSRRAA